jgi:hypothetical protein
MQFKKAIVFDGVLRFFNLNVGNKIGVGVKLNYFVGIRRVSFSFNGNILGKRE